MNIDVTIRFAAPSGATSEQLEELLEAALEHVDELRTEDVDLTANLAAPEATFTLYGNSETEPSIDRFLSDVRTALHVAGCATAGWEEATREVRAGSFDDDPLPA